MNKQAQVGLFTILGIVAVFAVLFVISDFGVRSSGYRIGVHFRSASGLRPAAQVFLSGVPVGAVDHISLLKDFSTEVVMSINQGYEIPVGSRFIIQAPITGEPTLLIQPPRDIAAGSPTLPHEIAPLADQPSGTNPTTFADLLEQGQGEVKRLDNMLAQVQQAEPQLLSQLKETLANANALTRNANTSLTSVAGKIDVLTDAVQKNLTVASGNVADLTDSLNATVDRDAPQIDTLLAQLNKTSKSFGDTVDSLHDVATDPRVKRNLIDTTRDFAATAKTFSKVASDLRTVTGNPQTQNQLRNTVANLDATTQRVNALIGQLGGSSSVYGVDASATPAPGSAPAGGGSAAPAQTRPLPDTPLASPSGDATPVPNSYGAPGGISPASSDGRPRGAADGTSLSSSRNATVATLRARVNTFTKDLVQLEIRAGDLAPLRPGSYNRNVSPLLTADRGPQSDVNLYVLPYGSTGLKLGFNDIGSQGTSSANFVLIKRAGPLSYGGGVEYSRLGAQASIAGKLLGLEGRLYDPRHPTLDSYVNIFALPKIQLFAGERDLTHASRRTAAGLQFEF